MNIDDIRNMIERGFNNATVQVDGDGTHFQAVVVTDEFEGLGMIDRHRKVYASLGEKVGGDIHALSILAYTRSEWDKQKPFSVVKT